MTDDYRAQLLRRRDAIDGIDDEILSLLNRRTEQVIEVGRLKQRHETGERSFYRPDREAIILRRLLEHNAGPIGSEAISAIFREIIAQSLSLEQRQKVAYLGPEGTFSEQAAVRHFGSSPDYCPCGSFDDVFRAAEHETVDWAVVPIENSTEGAVSRVLDLLMESPLKICAELFLPIRQNLLCLSDDLSKIKRVYSHQQSLSQCYHWLNDNLPFAERVAVASNGEAARLASLAPTVCAIAGDMALKRYPSLTLRYRHIEDEADNTTRFVVIGKNDAAPTGRDKTSLLLGIENRVGSMVDLIAPIAEQGISMSRFESRPAKRGLKDAIWEYVVFVDLLGHREDAPVARALEALRDRAGFVKILGAYPQGMR